MIRLGRQIDVVAAIRAFGSPHIEHDAHRWVGFPELEGVDPLEAKSIRHSCR